MRTNRLLYTIFLCYIFVTGLQSQEYEIRFELDGSSCLPNTMCYFIQVRSFGDSSWHLGTQNYRIFYDGSTASFIMNSAASLLPVELYSTALLQISVDNVDATRLSTSLPYASNLSFINYSIDLLNLVNGGVIVPDDGTWLSTSRLCFEAVEAAVQDSMICLQKSWAREELTEEYAAAYVVISSWESSYTSKPATGMGYIDGTQGGGCVTTQNIVINKTDLSCFEDEFGSVQFELDPDRNPYRITLPGATSFSSIRPGAYKAQIQDGSGCEFTRSFEILRPDELDIQVIHVASPRSSESSDGSIDIAVKGGTPPYYFEWRNGEELVSTKQNLREVPAGSYHLMVNDENQCEKDVGTVRIDAITSTNDPEILEKLSIYPNPVGDYLYLELLDNQLDPLRFELFDQSGRRVILNDQLGSINKISLESLDSGPYFMRLTFPNNKTVARPLFKS